MSVGPGRHLVVDVCTRTARGMRSVEPIRGLLDDLCVALELTQVYPPLVACFPFASGELDHFARRLRSEGVRSDTLDALVGLFQRRRSAEAGVSGISVLLESHAAVHTWPEARYVSFDLFSCRDFPSEQALELVLARFDVESWHGLDIVRAPGRPMETRKI